MKRFIAIALCLCFACGMAGCKKTPKDAGSSVIYQYEYESNGQTSSGKTDSNKSKDSTSNKSETGTTASKSESGASGGNSASGSKITVTNNCYSSGTKIAEKKVTLKVLTRDFSAGTTNFNNSAFTKYVESNMNVKLNFTVCSASDIITKMTLAYASGTNPYDMYMGMAPAGNFHTSYIKQGKLKKLDGLINTYGPNIKHLFKEYPEAQYGCTAEDGGIYMLPMVNDNENYCDLIYINMSWLASVGKSLPSTTNDFKAILTAFAQKYPGKTPFISTSDSGEDVGPSAFGPFGISTYHNWMYINQSNDTIKYTCTSDQYRTGLRYYNSLYSAGLLKFAADEDAVKKFTDSDSVGAVLCDSPDKAFDANTFNSKWTMCPVLNSSTGGTWANVKYENIWPEWFQLTSSCKYPEIAVRLCDWLYSKDGTLTAVFGPKGTYWDRSGDTITFNTSKIPKGKTEGEYINTLTPGYSLPKLLDKAYQDTKKSNTTSNSSTKMTDTIKQLQQKLIKPKASQKYYFPHLVLTDSESKQLSAVEDYQQFVWQMRLSFINGTKSIDSEWDSYVNTMNTTYKVGTLEKIDNTAYKRYKAWLSSQK